VSLDIVSKITSREKYVTSVISEESRTERRQLSAGEDDFVICYVHSKKGLRKKFVGQIKAASSPDS